MLREAGGNVLHPVRVEGLTAGGFRELAKNVVALILAGAEVGADRVDDGFSALAHLDGFGLEHAAVIVISVGNEDDRFADIFLGPQGLHLVAAGLVKGVEERCAATGAQAANAGV